MAPGGSPRCRRESPGSREAGALGRSSGIWRTSSVPALVQSYRLEPCYGCLISGDQSNLSRPRRGVPSLIIDEAVVSDEEGGDFIVVYPGAFGLVNWIINTVISVYRFGVCLYKILYLSTLSG